MNHVIINVDLKGYEIVEMLEDFIEHTYQASYITEQGVPQHYGANREKLKVTAIEAMKHYLASSDTISEELIGTFTVI